MDNVLGTHNLLEACRLHALGKSLVKFVHCSTDEVYGESQQGQSEKAKTEETSLLMPTNPYAASKAAAEMYVRSYHTSFQMPVVITRCNNIYGPNQHHEKLIPRFASLVAKGEKMTVQGNGSCLRSFLHAEDAAGAFWRVLSHGNVGEVYNIGCHDHEYTVLDVAKKIINIAKPNEDPKDWIEYIEDRPFNDKRYFIDCRKIDAIGWKKKFAANFDEKLREIVCKKK